MRMELGVDNSLPNKSGKYFRVIKSDVLKVRTNVFSEWIVFQELNISSNHSAFGHLEDNDCLPTQH